jgi:transcription elongation factor GreA
MAQQHELSPAAHERLLADLTEMTTVGRIDIARKIEAARELGDLKENGDYHAAKEEQGKMEGRIMHLHSIVDNCQIVEGTGDTDSVTAGSIVSITYAGDDTVEKYLVGSIEEQREDVIVVSPGSPMGSALLGAAVGDAVEYQAPRGAMLKIKVVEIE